MTMANIVRRKINDRFVAYDPYTHELVVSKRPVDGDFFPIAKQEDIKKKAELKILRKSDITQIYMILTTECNFACKYCRQRQEKSCSAADSVVMSEEVAIDIVDKFLKIDAGSNRKGIVFYGGEPLLAKALLVKIVKYIRRHDPENNIELNLFTNGTMNSEEFSKVLAENNVFVILSYDGLPQNNDRLRVTKNGGPTSQQAIDGFRLYKKHNCKIGISMTVGSHNIETLADSIDYISSLNPENIGFNLPHDDSKNPLRHGTLSIDHFVQKSIDIFWEASKNGLYAEHIIRKVRLFAEKKFKFAECPAVLGRIVVMPNGEIGVCEGAIGYKEFFYNLDNWERLEPHRMQWKKQLPIFDERCEHCPAIGICGGGCLLDGYFEDGILSNFNSVRCRFTKAILEKILIEATSNRFIENDVDHYVLPDDKRREFLNSLTNSVSERSKPLHTSASVGECCAV